MRLNFAYACVAVLFALSPVDVRAQQIKFSQPHGFCDAPFSLQISVEDSVAYDQATIRYTLDGSEPTATSKAYQAPLAIKGNTIVRAVCIADTGQVTPIATATYLFMDDVLKQSNTPQGYPSEWGAYTQEWGTAIADYEMDPEMTNDPSLRPKIIEGLKQLPVLSIVTDKDNLFSHENDSVTGGIYIFTGPPVGDATGHGWTRPASIELFGGPQHHDLSVNCGLRLHGGHGRLAEKNPKHSFRLVFKEKYGGPKTLKYPLYGEDEPSKFDQLVLRCHFGNAWQHWDEGNRKKAQYTRDVWTRRMQRKMGWTSVNALYVHVFLNGMYWGMYNIAERVDDQYGKDHLGGKKDDIDVVKIEEDGGNHIEAAEGDLEAWELLTQTAAQAANSEEAYLRLQGLNADGVRDSTLEPLLDIDNFIDYMLINQYGGNTDWDHHNWYALRRKGADSQGFRFLCWDTEIIFINDNENVLAKNNGKRFPTGIFNNLLHNNDFARRYIKRAKNLLAEDGLLGEASTVAVWDSLYNTISSALYAEAARWGDYRRDVHPYTSRGQLYTVDQHYMAERERLLTQYFPYRSDYVLSCIQKYVDIDDFEAPADWEKLTASMFFEWNGTDADATPKGTYNVEWNLGASMSNGGVVMGTSGVEEYRFADLSPYSHLVLRGQGSIRILANRLVAHGPYKEIIVSLNESDPYWDADIQAIILPLDNIRTALTNEGKTRTDSFVHLNAMKAPWNNSATLRNAYLIPGNETDIADIKMTDHHPQTLFNLKGQAVKQPRRGLYIVNGKKVVVN